MSESFPNTLTSNYQLFQTNSSWNAGVGPAKDLYYIGDNPQYSLTQKNPESSAWILLTRHITDRVNNLQYFSIL